MKKHILSIKIGEKKEITNYIKLKEDYSYIEGGNLIYQFDPETINDKEIADIIIVKDNIEYKTNVFLYGIQEI